MQSNAGLARSPMVEIQKRMQKAYSGNNFQAYASQLKTSQEVVLSLVCLINWDISHLHNISYKLFHTTHPPITYTPSPYYCGLTSSPPRDVSASYKEFFNTLASRLIELNTQEMALSAVAQDKIEASLAQVIAADKNPDAMELGDSKTSAPPLSKLLQKVFYEQTNLAQQLDSVQREFKAQLETLTQQVKHDADISGKKIADLEFQVRRLRTELTSAQDLLGSSEARHSGSQDLDIRVRRKAALPAVPDAKISADSLNKPAAKQSSWDRFARSVLSAGAASKQTVSGFWRSKPSTLAPEPEETVGLLRQGMRSDSPR
jgi:hypothetical protein